MRRIVQYWVVTLSIVCAGSAAFSAEHKAGRAFVDPIHAGPSFFVQGEYTGVINTDDGKMSFGVQVIALGNKTFRAVAYRGGLPGAGWDGSDKIITSGKTENGKTTFVGEKAKGVIQNNVLTVYSTDGDKLSTFKKVQRKSPTLGAKPPRGALVLFDGTNVKQWETGKIVKGHLLGVPARTKQKFRDFTLHIEFRTPYMPDARGQGRGNSGVYLLDQYECQVLDSFGLEGENNECGGIYKVAKPKVNMCFPPLSWQTYDIEFRAARFDDSGKKTAPAVATIRHNGVVIHKNLKITHTTPGGRQRDEKPGALYLQNHGNPVVYRNIWIVVKK